MPHNLPAEPNRFIGRARDIDELRGLFDEDRIVTLAGVGGIGKTRLAMRVATESLADFPGGVWLVELAKINRPELIVQELADVLGVRGEGSRPLMESLIVRLRDRRTLLVVDNCEHLVEACAEVVGSLAASCPDVRVLCTSREPLHIRGELIWRVPPLGVATEAVQLFVDRALAAGSRLDMGDESMRAVVELCVALDGLPLAIELAAARTNVLSPAQITGRIGDRFRLLTTGDRDAPNRQRTLLATVEWSHSLLDERERVLLRRLSVFAGAFDLGLAEQICSDRYLQEWEILDLLGSLVDKSLVLAGGDPVTYRLLETIRQYAAERLVAEAEQKRMRDRHLDVLAERAVQDFELGLAAPRTPWPQRLATLIRARGLLDDYRAALGWAMESGDAPRGLRLASHAGGVWVSLGRVAECVTWQEKLLGLDTSQVDAVPLALARGILAMALTELDQPARALELASGALEELRKPPHTFGVGVIHVTVVSALFRIGHVERAMPYLEDALEVTAAHDDTFNETIALLWSSGAAMLAGRLREAQRQAERALLVAEDNGHYWVIARTLAQLGEVAAQRGDFAAARDYYEAALPKLEELGNQPELARCLARIGRVAVAQRDFALARARLATSLELSKQAGQRHATARALRVLADLAEAQGDMEGAVLAMAAATAIREAVGQAFSAVKVEELLARARVMIGEGRTGSLWARGAKMAVHEVADYVLWKEHEPSGPPVQPGTTALLTAREAEIAGLLTKGLSNRAIADELVISPATVARHIANIMDKLGHTSRAQIAVWASDHGLGSA